MNNSKPIYGSHLDNKYVWSFNICPTAFHYMILKRMPPLSTSYKNKRYMESPNRKWFFTRQ